MNTRDFPFLIGAIIAGMIALTLLVLPTPTSSAPSSFYTVVTTTADEFDTSGTGTGCSLREAIYLANNYGTGNPVLIAFGGCTANNAPGFLPFTIYVPTGTYTLSILGAGEDNDATGDLDIRVSMTISGTGLVTVTANPGWNDRIFHIVSGNKVTIKGIGVSHGSIVNGAGGGIYNAATASLSDVTLYNNSTSGGGGGIYNAGILTLTDSTIISNVAANGGGLYNDGTTALTNVTLTGNSAANGGGIYNNATLMLSSATLTGNSSNNNGSGGGIYNNNATLTLSGVTLGNNSSSDSGGGIYTYRGLATLTNVVFNSNSTTNYGGGIYSTGVISNGNILQGLMTLTKVTFSGNSSSFAGGGIANFMSTAVMTNGTFAGNWANGGGGIWNAGTVTMTNITLSGNSAKNNGNGGGIYNYGGAGTVTNATLSGNSANSGGGIYDYNGYAPPVLTFQNTILDQKDTGGNCGFFGISDVSNGYNLSSDNSCFFNQTGDMTNTIPNLAPLGNYGGLTLTQIPFGSSPAINKIPNGTNGCGTIMTTDQRGKPRPVNGACDIGAVERQIVDGPFLYLPLILR